MVLIGDADPSFAGVVSADPERSRQGGQQLGLARPYGSVAEMIGAERQRPDGIDAVSIMTPNDRHHAEVFMKCDVAMEQRTFR